MDHHKKKNNTILNPFSQIYSSKKAIKILLTLPLFCILFSYSLFSSLFSTFSMKLLSYYYYTDRNYIFLLCNGILILIIKNSGLFAIAPSNTDHLRDNSAKKNVQSHQSNGFREYNLKKNTRLNPFSGVSSQTNAGDITKAVVEVDKAENVTLIEEKEEEEEVDEFLNIVEEGEKEEEEFVNMEEEEEEGIGLLSREELNKKCEEFITKMKYGIKFEAQHHLIMVK